MLRNLNAERILGTPRVGVPASSVPATGTDGPGYLYPWLREHPEHAGALVCGRITVQPSAGVLVADEDTGFIYTPDGDGAFSFVFQPYADGVAAGPARSVSLYSGEEEPASAPVAWAGLALPATLGALAWDYTPPPPDTHAFAPVGLALDTAVGAIAWNYLPPASEAAFEPGTVPLQTSLGALAWAYVSPSEQPIAGVSQTRVVDAGVQRVAVRNPAVLVPLDVEEVDGIPFLFGRLMHDDAERISAVEVTAEVLLGAPDPHAQNMVRGGYAVGRRSQASGEVSFAVDAAGPDVLQGFDARGRTPGNVYSLRVVATLDSGRRLTGAAWVSVKRM